MNKFLSKTMTMLLLFAILNGPIPELKAQDQTQDLGEHVTIIYLPMVLGDLGNDSGPAQLQDEHVAEAVLGEVSNTQLAEKPADARDDISEGQLAPDPGLEPPTLESADAKTAVAAEENGVSPAAVDGWTTILNEGFEGTFPYSGWRVLDGDGTANGEYYWDDDDYKPYTGSWSAWAANGGRNALDPQYYNYPNNMRSWMIYGPFDLSNATDAELLFNYWNRSEYNYDYFGWYASVNGTNFYGTRVSGDSGGWRSVNFDLTAVPMLGNVTRRSAVWIAFYFSSDSSVTSKGPFVDNVKVQKLVNTISCSNQYKAEYFNNRTLSGTPVVTRCENWPIKYDWGNGSPVGGVASDNFSVRWTGNASIPSGSYVFAARADDGIRVWLDNGQIINSWIDQAPTPYWTTRNIAAGLHAIKVEYYENGGGALAEFRWFSQPDIASARNQLKTMTSIMTNPWKQVNAPIQNGPGQRQSLMYYSVIEQFEVTWTEFSGRYRPGGGVPDTRCNIYAGDVIRAMNTPLPTKGELGVGASGSQWTDPMTANARNLNEFLNGHRASSNSANNGWRPIDPTTAQGLQQLISHLRDGKPALASNTGHIAVLRPSQDGVTRWQDLRIAQAGARNFLNDRLEVGFGVGSRPQFFIRD